MGSNRAPASRDSHSELASVSSLPSSLWLSRDAGARFEPIRSIAPRELRSVTAHRGDVFLGLVGRERPGTTPTSAWIVRAA